MGVFEQFPYANMHEMNLEWLLKKMKELDQAMETFKATESLKFADPIIWDITTQYEKSTIVLDPTGNAYLSLQAVPAGVQLNNDEYWLEIFNFTEYTRTANQNLTVNVETNTTRATAAYQVDDWLIWNDVLYRVTSPIAIDDALIVAPAAGSNIVHFTVEDFIKAFITYATGLIQQYKNDIDASELAYRQQLAQDIANTTASLQAQLDAAIAGATVDSEVINARIGADGITYATLGDAIRTQIGILDEDMDAVTESLGRTVFPFTVTENASIASDGTDTSSTTYSRIEYIDISGYDKIKIRSRSLRFYYFTYNANYGVQASSGWITGEQEITPAATTKYLRLIVRQPSGAPNTPPTTADTEAAIEIFHDIPANIAEQISTNTDNIQINSDEIKFLNLNGGSKQYQYTVTEGGSINSSDGSDTTSPNYSRIEYIDISGIKKLYIGSNRLRYYFYTYNSSYTVVTSNGWLTGDNIINITPTMKYIRLVVRNESGAANVSPTEYATKHSIIINALSSSYEDNVLMRQNFIPAKSTRYIFAKGKMWVKDWNTAAAFTAAGQDPDCWGISADVRVTSDGYLVCFHDASVDYQTDGSGQIEDMTWAQVQQLNVTRGVWNGSSWVPEAGGATEKIPLLTEFLDICRKYGKVAFIETKAAGSPAIGNIGNGNIDIIMNEIYSRGMENSCAFIAPAATMAYLVSNYTKIYRCRLFDPTFTNANIYTYAYDANTVYGAYNSELDASKISLVHTLKHFVIGYTPRTNPASDDVEMVNKGLDAIFLFRDPPTI